MVDWKADRIGSALRGENPMVIARMRSGFAVIGDTQHLPGYSLLLSDDPSADHLTDLDWPRRAQFMFDLALIGEAVQNACGDRGLRRINYEILGNSMAWLHGHVHARYEWEAPERLKEPVWSYPRAERHAPEHDYSDSRHGVLRSQIQQVLERLMPPAYADSDCRGNCD